MIDNNVALDPNVGKLRTPESLSKKSKKTKKTKKDSFTPLTSAILIL
ncbi:MAG: hypothetical protein Q8912_07385 [Bacillota bacterium]|nr:hypothetical protein [Bacillota bacterium]